MLEKDNININLEFVEKMYKYMKNNMPIESFMEKFHLSYNEFNGLLELCRIYDKEIDITECNGTLVFKKNLPRKIISSKPNFDDNTLIHTSIGVVSDTHFGNIHQQLHLLNNFYEEAYKRDIKIILHCGDVTDGNYLNRLEQPRQQFLHGFDEQVSYVVDMYPKIKDLKTYYILGSHDETHYKNGQSTVDCWLSRCRNDLIFLGQDTGNININGVKIVMDHPGGGSAQSVSYKPQKRIEILESGHKPKIIIFGHYHKMYSFVYRNVRGIETGTFCDKTQFQQKQGLSNYVGGYFLDIYSDSKGNIIYFEPEEILYKPKDMWDEAFKDKKKIKKLVIK